MAMLHTGMGLYPGDSCYMANRPSWLPYSMDTVGEGKCVDAWIAAHPSVSSTGLIPPPVPDAPQTAEEMASWTPNDIYLAQQAQWEEWKNTNRNLATYDLAPGEKPPPSGLSAWWEQNKWFLMAGGLGVFAIAFTGRR
jgi:hypothetical protein